MTPTYSPMRPAPTPRTTFSWSLLCKHASVALIIGAVACGGGSDLTGPPGGGGGGGGGGGSTTVASVALNQTSASITTGATVTLVATPRDAQGNAISGSTVTWSTSDSTIAAVSSAGVVTGKGPGTATITAKSGTASASAVITVSLVPIASIAVTPATDTLVRFGDTVSFAAVVKDGSGNVLTGRTLVWTSSNDTVATVSPAGLVTAVHTGTATITATGGGHSGTATVVIPSVSKIVITPSSSSVRVGASDTLTVSLYDASGQEVGNRLVQLVSITPSNPAPISVIGTVITGVAAGTATVTYESEGVTATATITVTP